jgi:5-methylcytosine-specific restriction endonuclease McrA
MKRVYLTLGQGVTDSINIFGRQEAFARLKAKALSIRSNYDFKGFSADENMILDNTGLGADYQQANIYYKEYIISDLPTNETLERDFKLMLYYYLEYLNDENVLTLDTDFSTAIGSVEEGKRALKQHYIRERNHKIIKDVKNRFFSKHGKFFCTVCNFIFEEHYGDRGKSYIEGHHTKSVSQMQPGDMTMPEDIALLCSNCHRMIHVKYPWLTIDELKRIYKK